MDFLKDSLALINDKKASSSFFTKWFWYLVAGLVTVAVISFLFVSSWFKSQKLAKVEHQLDVEKELKKQKEVNSTLRDLEEEKTQKIIKAKEQLQTVVEEEKKIEQAIETSNKNEKVINSIKGWDDVRKKIKY